MLDLFTAKPLILRGKYRVVRDGKETGEVVPVYRDRGFEGYDPKTTNERALAAGRKYRAKNGAMLNALKKQKRKENLEEMRAYERTMRKAWRDRNMHDPEWRARQAAIRRTIYLRAKARKAAAASQTVGKAFPERVTG